MSHFERLGKKMHTRIFHWRKGESNKRNKQGIPGDRMTRIVVAVYRAILTVHDHDFHME